MEEGEIKDHEDWYGPVGVGVETGRAPGVLGQQNLFV